MRSAPLFQLVMMPSRVLLITASSADSIIAESQYGASSGLRRFSNWVFFAASSRDLPSERFLDITCENLRCVRRRECCRGLQGKRIIAGEKSTGYKDTKA